MLRIGFGVTRALAVRRRKQYETSSYRSTFCSRSAPCCLHSIRGTNTGSHSRNSGWNRSTETVVADITRLENEWVTAIIKKDAAALDNLLAVDFNGTSPTGDTFPRSDAIEDLKSGAYEVEPMALDEISVNVYGDTAVVFTSQQEKSKYDGKDNSGHYHFTNVWVKRDGKWKVVASHGSRYGK